jgi:hypothetical protein
MVARYRRVAQTESPLEQDVKKKRADRIERITAKLHALIWIAASAALILYTNIFQMALTDQRVNRYVTKTAFNDPSKKYISLTNDNIELLQDIPACCCHMFRSEYGSSSIFDTLASSDHENNCSLGNLLPSFNTDFDNLRIAISCVIHDRILASIRNVITSYNHHSAHGLLVFNTFHTMAMLSLLLPFI